MKLSLIIQLTIAYLLGIVLAGALSYYTVYIYAPVFWFAVVFVWGCVLAVRTTIGR